jgi:hypothetical protein
VPSFRVLEVFPLKLEVRTAVRAIERDEYALRPSDQPQPAKAGFSPFGCTSDAGFQKRGARGLTVTHLEVSMTPRGKGANPAESDLSWGE